jgi:murein DD-endopeptidase MepM/ murein hydrolase activator NlpD
VKVGTMVSTGDVIGYSGGAPGTRGAGKMTTGPHLHFEVLVNEVYKNPVNYLPKSAGKL